MNAQEFAYWLQGFFELNEEDKSLTKKQVKIIRDHLSLVFKKVTHDRNVGDQIVFTPEVAKHLGEKLIELSNKDNARKTTHA